MLFCLCLGDQLVSTVADSRSLSMPHAILSRVRSLSPLSVCAWHALSVCSLSSAPFSLQGTANSSELCALSFELPLLPPDA